MSFAHPILLLWTLLAAAVAAWRLAGVELPRSTRALATIALCLLALATGGARLEWPLRPRVLVLVDVSPSVRGGSFAEDRWVSDRLARWAPEADLTLRNFADGETPREAVVQPERTVDATRLPPIEPGRFDAVLLFTDARFDPPVEPAPPLIFVRDLHLDAPYDAAVTSLDIDAGGATVGVRNPGPPLKLAPRTQAGLLPPVAVAGGAESLLRVPLPPDATTLSASVAASDRWPENDVLSTFAPPPDERPRWWVSTRPPPQGYTAMAPAQLPTDQARLLEPAVVVLDNIPLEALPPDADAALAQYVRDLGGGLVIGGGDRSLSAGGYAGTRLDAVSPLASSPPEPSRDWLILVDSSGSMADPAGGGRSRWQVAIEATAAAANAVPPNESLRAGDFAERVRWWGTSAPTRIAIPTPPADARPSGPTNLEPALRDAAAAVDVSRPTTLLLVTDANVRLSEPAAAAELLRSKRVTLLVLATGGIPADSPLPTLAERTGGRVLASADPAAWARDLASLTRSATVRQADLTPVRVRWSDGPERDASPTNLTWPRAAGVAIATRSDGSPAAARWNVGAGRVAAVGFSASAEELARVADGVAAPPRDPQRAVTIEVGREMRVRVSAITAAGPANGLAFEASLSPIGAPASSRPLRQTGPGRYEVTTGVPRRSSLLTLREGNRVLDRRAVAGRYPAEFDRVGNDVDAMQRMADATGGFVITADREGRLPLPRRVQPVDLAVLSLAGALLCVVGSLACWRLLG